MGVVVGLVHETIDGETCSYFGSPLATYQHTPLETQLNNPHPPHPPLDPAQALATTNTLRIEWATDMIEESGISWGSHDGDATRRGRGVDVQV